MPFVDELNGFRPPSGVAPTPEAAPQSEETFSAAFRQGNTLVSGLHFLNLPRFSAEDGYNPVDDLKVRRPDLFYAQGDRFTGSNSSKQTDQIISEIEREEGDKKTLAASGWLGTVAGLGAGALDPTMFLPLGAVAKVGVAGETALSTAGTVAKLALMQSTAQEALLSGTQQTRTLSESAANIGSATLLGGMLGAAGHALLAREGLAEKGAADLDASRQVLSEHNGVAGPVQTAPAGITDVYHGSPYDFGQFDSGKIGTGEGGGELFGHYVTSDKTLAEGYRGVSGALDSPVRTARAWLDRADGDRQAAIDEIKGYTDPKYVEAVKLLQDPSWKPEGNLYQAKIKGDPLDLQKPFAEQPPKVQQALSALGVTEGSGMQAYEALADRLGGKQQASEALREAGVPSATFVGEADARNYVVFDDRAVGITHKNGEPIAAPNPAARAPASIGAAVADTRDLSPTPYGLDSIPGVGKAVSKMYPTLDALTNGSDAAKRAVTELAEIPLALKANVEGQTATRYGGPAIDREIKLVREGLHAQAEDQMLAQWTSYLESQGQKPGAVQRMTGSGRGAMSFDDFDANVYDALSTGDQHPIPQVAAVAQWMRKNGFDPIKERASAIEGFSETKLREGETYAPRLWNKDKISAQWNDYVKTWTDHLEGEQTRKAQLQQQISAYHGAMESHAGNIDKLQAKIDALAADAEVIQARAEEATRMNKAAFERSTALRESQYRNDGGIRVDVPGKGIEKARGGAVFETKARQRGNELADRASGKLAEIDRLERQLAAETQSHDAMRAKIEDGIEQWGGKSAREAVRALAAREEAAAERAAAMEAGTSKSTGERLTSADRAVDRAAKSILGSDRTLDRQELRSRAEQIASRQIGTPDGRLPYDSAETHGEGGPGGSELRGHAARREIDLPYDIAKPWLDRSATQALKSYTHSVLPDAIIAERFGGDPAMTSVMKDIESAYAAKRAAAGDNEAAQNKLKAAMDNDIRIVAGIRDRTRGTFANDPQMRSLARLSQNALKINNVISSHGMAVASLPDFAGVVFRNGLQSAFRDAWIPFFNSLIDKEAWAAVKAAGNEWKAYGIGIETQSASRNHALSDINENYRPTSKFERALSWVSDKAFLVNLLAPLTDIQKRMATNAISHNILRMSQAVAEGKATAKDIQRLAEGNVTEAQAARIYEQFSNNGGANVKGILLPNTAGWTDEATRKAFVGAVARDVDIAVVQPGQEKPFFMSKPGYNVLGQYKAFAFASTQRILMANLQRHDAASMSGLMVAIGMGMLSYRINTMASGQPVSDRPQDWIKEGINRGGILGVFDDVNSLAAKATGGKVDVYRAIGADKPLTRFVNRDAASMFLGPTYGKVQSLMQVSRAASNPSTWGESDSHALRMMTLGTNFPYLPRLFDQVEIGVNHALGIPMKARN